MMRLKRMTFIFAVVLVSSFVFNLKVSAAGFPDTIKSSINCSGSCLVGDSSIGRLYKKEYSSSNPASSGKAFCTSFQKIASNGVTCKKVNWSSDSELNKRVAAMIGSVINSARSSDGSITWDNYYYAEIAINRLLEYGISKGYGTTYNSTSGFKKSAAGFNYDKYQKFLSTANYTYNNYGNTKIEFSQPTYSNNKATVTITCKDYKGAKIACNMSQSDTTVTTTLNGASKTGTKIFSNNSDKTVTLGVDVSSFINQINTGNNTLVVNFSAKSTQYWATAQNYSCGTNYQSLTPNKLVQTSTTKSGNVSMKKSIYKAPPQSDPTPEPTPTPEPRKYTLDIFKHNREGNLIDGAVVKVEYSGTSENIPVTNGYVTLTDLTYAGEYCVSEVTAPSGYIKVDDRKCVTLNDDTPDGSIAFANDKEIKRRSLTINKIDENGEPVVGAQINVVDEECMISLLSEDGDTSSCIVSSFETDGNPKVISNVTVGDMYVVAEEKLPSEGGYAGGVMAAQVTISEDDSQNVVTLTNTHSSIKISKQSITSSKELPGAKLTITNAQGEEVASWTSSDKEQEITGLADGDYTLTETTAPKGYTVAESITFTIENGKLKGDDDNTLVMKDATIVEVPDTFNVQNIIGMLSGIMLVGIGTGVLFYETKRKKKA